MTNLSIYQQQKLNGKVDDMFFADGYYCYVTPDEPQTQEEFNEVRARANKGDARAQMLLGLCLQKGKFCLQDEVAAYDLFAKSAKAGDPKGMCCLGLVYTIGIGTNQDSAKSLQCFKTASAQGDKRALYELALFLYSVKGKQPNDQKLLEWCINCANEGDAKAQHALALRYANGYGVPKDKAQALTWYEKSAVQGLAFSQWAVARLYAKGEEVEQNLEKAEFWFKKAADQTSEFKYDLACFYRENKKKTQAFDAFLASAEGGCKWAFIEVATCFEHGIGTTADKDKAIFWYQKAAKTNTKAKQKLKELQG